MGSVKSGDGLDQIIYFIKQKGLLENI